MFAMLIHRLLRPWPFVPLAMLLVGALELAVADRKYGIFSGGFGQSTTVDMPGELAIFLTGFVLAQIAAALLAWRIAGWLARDGGGHQAMVHFAFLYGGLSVIALTAQYQLHSYFSDAVSFALLKQLGGGSAGDALLFAKNEIALALAGMAVVLVLWWGTAWLVGRLPGSSDAQHQPPAWRWIGGAWAALLAALLLVPHLPGDSAKNLNRIIAWNAVSSAMAQASDFDGDGYGLAGLQIDTHPFDHARHPLALDIPGNGVDEDGYGGDLALVPVPQIIPPAKVTGERPHVVLVVMESTRADVLAKRIDGQPVAPNLEAIVAQGSAIAPAYSHVGFTTSSLKSLFGGALAVAPDGPSLFRDLKQSGYRIGVFSGQPEDFGGISEATGMRDNADIFVDAEALKDQRAFSFAAQGSLLVDEAIIVAEFAKALGHKRDWAQPQFIYLNFQSAHFPYHHDGVPERFAHPSIERGAIRAENRDQVERTYWNAVAHADSALGGVVAQLKTLGVWDDTILLVTGDHGEALFEQGFLGHGHRINRIQNATFLASNRPMEGASAPIALSDYRPILLGMLGAELPAQPRSAPFMHIGPLDHPAAIGTVDDGFGIVSLRFDRGEACFETNDICRAYDRLTGPERAAVDALVARWGSERWAARQSGAAATGG